MLSSRMENLHPYVPGEQPRDREYIKLNANENPYPPSPAALERAIEWIKSSPQSLALYANPDSLSLREKIAAMLNATGGVLSRARISGEKISPCGCDEIGFEITSEMIYAGNGSDEVLSFLFYAFFDSAEKLISPEFSYSFYPVYCGFHSIQMEKIPLLQDWQIDVDEMISRAKKFHAPTILANPNAPTSLCLSREQVRRMLEECPRDRAFVVDEAYVDFGGESCLPLLRDFENLVIVRTFSKSLCAAGMRLGYLVANPKMVNAVLTVKNSVNHFPIDAFAQTFGCAICEDVPYYAECAKKIVSQRDDFSEFLRARGFFVLPSRTNFLFTKKDGRSGKAMYESLKKEGILVRRFDTEGIEEFLRITVGTEAQMSALKRTMEKLDF